MRSSWARQKSLWRGGERRRASTPPANPIPDAANLRAYMEGDNLDGANNSTLLDGDAMASVVNLGTLGGTFTQGTLANRPLFSLTAGPSGTKPALTFDGTDSLVSSVAAASWAFLHDGTGATIYALVKTSASAEGTLVATSTGGGASIGVIHRYSAGFAVSYAMNDGVSFKLLATAPAASVTNGSFDMSTSTMAVADTPDLSLYANGVSVVTANSGGFTAAAPAGSLAIGTRAGGTIGVIGSYRRLMVYGVSHTPAQVAAVLAYMQTLDAVIYPAP